MGQDILQSLLCGFSLIRQLPRDRLGVGGYGQAQGQGQGQVWTLEA